jgi:dipeptidyl aminopeptidase/acylaminoacyl peptidase
MTRVCRYQVVRTAPIILLAAALSLPGLDGLCQTVYHTPPKEIADVIDAPSPLTAYVSPAHDKILLAEPVRFPDISDLARPMFRVAGLRIDPANNGAHLPQRFINWQLVTVTSGASLKVAMPATAYAGAPIWSPDGKRFAFLNYGSKATELWIGDGHTGAVHRVGLLDVNAVIEPSGRGAGERGGGPVAWMPDSQRLLVRLVPTGRGAPPKEPAVVEGPIVQEAIADPSPVATFEDLLTSPYDEDVFTYYATAQLALVDVVTDKAQTIGKPEIIASNAASPDGQHILVASIHKPYSYLVTQTEFPRRVEVWDSAGHIQYQLADLPLTEHTPINGAPNGPRSYEWIPTQPATLAWVETLDGGDPRKKVLFRDHVLMLAAPFRGSPAEMVKTEQRFAGIEWGAKGDLAILRDSDHRTATNRVFFLDPNHLEQAPRLVYTLNARSQYDNPGNFVQEAMPNGMRAVLETDGSVFLTGAGASAQGNHPFLDRLDLKTLQATRLFHCGAQEYESVEALLAPDGSRFLTRHETPKDPPNFFVRSTGGEDRAISHFVDPTPILRSVRTSLVTYKRADGVPLSMTVSLPPDYKEGERRPAILIGYPLEYTNAKMAGQVTGSPYKFLAFSESDLGPGGGDSGSPMYLVLHGYVILSSVAMPIVGSPATVNDTFIEQLVSDAKAAIDKAADMGIIDPNRVAAAGHSYGAFMTANLLAHSDLFRAGCAQSGAYNRTLTPFGFQSERRTFWESKSVYEEMSPFFFADKLKTPILLVHGIDDNNNGTFPIQSLRMYQALQGNGGIVRYIQLPYESHIYVGKQSIAEVEWEQMMWFDKYVRDAPPSTVSVLTAKPSGSSPVRPGKQ